MRILPVSTPVLKEGDDLADIVAAHAEFEDGDILVVSSKAVATVEGAAIDLRNLRPTDEAKLWAERCGRSPAFRQAILDETKRLRGSVVGGSPLAMLTELEPDGLHEGTLLVPNAGLDQSNIEENFCIGWPKDPVGSLRSLRKEIERRTGKRVSLIMSDSCCRPRRWGVTAFALAASGIDPLSSLIGKKDLFGNELKMTMEARADQIATAANFVMGNSNESIPAAIIRDHGLPFTDFEGWVPGIRRGDDLFTGAF